MWQLESGLWQEKELGFFNAVTTSRFGNLRDTEARKTFCDDNAVDFKYLVTAQQVHGSKVVAVTGDDAGKEIPECDGLITNVEGLPIAIFTADCVPVFLAARKKKVISVVHAGWRGIKERIILESLKIFENEFDVLPQEITAAIGPHIQKCCYDIGGDFKEIFGLANEETSLDLSLLAVGQLKSCGVETISVNSHCTQHEKDMFFSYRRDKTSSRMMSVIKI